MVFYGSKPPLFDHLMSECEHLRKKWSTKYPGAMGCLAKRSLSNDGIYG